MGRLMEPLGLYDAGYESSMSYVSTCRTQLLCSAALVARSAQRYFSRFKFSNGGGWPPAAQRRRSAAPLPLHQRCTLKHVL